MFYLAEVEDHIRVEPKHFGLPTHESIEKQLEESYVSSISKDLGFVLSVISVEGVGDGIIIPGDGAAFYKSRFRVLIWKPEMHELVFGTIKEITNFGAFMSMANSQGMIHVSQTMEDYVSINKSGILQGKSTKRSLKVGDNCLARIVAISFKSGEPKIGLTMRQPGLGKLEWIKEDKLKEASKAKKIAKKSKKEKNK
ncbi:DNA-directed RNA polymerase [Candidatus Parvarchaeota archaeon]|jgi:DNA-directed RNA polymerase subunit E'|nr:MAG: DNA-directed RNA polymerase [Candidatus Parvarchaeota archaeon]PXY71593.1 MAG: DNA-directed RNA polymerase [Candidatus Parvarchaeota archaeon]